MLSDSAVPSVTRRAEVGRQRGVKSGLKALGYRLLTNQ